MVEYLAAQADKGKDDSGGKITAAFTAKGLEVGRGSHGDYRHARAPTPMVAEPMDSLASFGVKN